MAEAGTAGMPVGLVVAEDGDEQPGVQDLLGPAADAGLRIHHHHLLPLGIFENQLQAWRCLPLFWRSWSDTAEVGSWGLGYLGNPEGMPGRLGTGLMKYIY